MWNFVPHNSVLKHQEGVKLPLMQLTRHYLSQASLWNSTLGFKNAFTTIQHDHLHHVVREELHFLVWQLYSYPTKLVFGTSIIQSVTLKPALVPIATGHPIKRPPLYKGHLALWAPLLLSPFTLTSIKRPSPSLDSFTQHNMVLGWWYLGWWGLSLSLITLLHWVCN